MRPRDNSQFDLPQLQKLKLEMEGMQRLLSFMPFLEFIGMRFSPETKAIVQQLPKIRAELEELGQVMMEFNARFGPRGWITYGSLNFPLQQQALDLAREGLIEEAEQRLVDHFNTETIRFQLMGLRNSKVFAPRMQLLELAFVDYQEARYHSTVPILLMMLDGAVSDVEGGGFFAQQTDLTAWDCIAGHSSGLTSLRQLFYSARNKTRVEPIQIPHRNGILHGRDLGYANKVVAAKCWSALFAVAEWISSLQKSGREAPQGFQLKRPTLLETMASAISSYRSKEESLGKLALTIQRSNEWKPREFVPNVDFDRKGKESDFEPSSPEAAVAKFLTLWVNSNYGAMASLIDFELEEHPGPHSQLAGLVRKSFGGYKLREFSIDGITDGAPGLSRIEVTCIFEGREESAEYSLTLWYQDGSFNLMPRWDSGGSWMIAQFDPSESFD